MEHERSSRRGSLQVALLAAIGSGALAACSLVTGFDRHRDGGSDIDEHDAAVSTPDDDEDAGADDDGDDATAEGDAASNEAGADPGTDPPADAAVAPEDAGAAVTDAALGPAPAVDSGGAVEDAGASRPSIKDLIDALGGSRKDRTDKVCACQGAGQACVRADWGKSSCLERGIMLLAGTAEEESMRALLECMLPAERAYTACVEMSLRCQSVETSTAACSLEYELATARCNVSSIQGLSLQRLCSR